MDRMDRLPGNFIIVLLVTLIGNFKVTGRHIESDWGNDLAAAIDANSRLHDEAMCKHDICKYAPPYYLMLLALFLVPTLFDMVVFGRNSQPANFAFDDILKDNITDLNDRGVCKDEVGLYGPNNTLQNEFETDKRAYQVLLKRIAALYKKRKVLLSKRLEGLGGSGRGGDNPGRGSTQHDRSTSMVSPSSSKPRLVNINVLDISAFYKRPEQGAKKMASSIQKSSEVDGTQRLIEILFNGGNSCGDELGAILGPISKFPEEWGRLSEESLDKITHILQIVSKGVAALPSQVSNDHNESLNFLMGKSADDNQNQEICNQTNHSGKFLTEKAGPGNNCWKVSAARTKEACPETLENRRKIMMATVESSTSTERKVTPSENDNRLKIEYFDKDLDLENQACLFYSHNTELSELVNLLEEDGRMIIQDSVATTSPPSSNKPAPQSNLTMVENIVQTDQHVNASRNDKMVYAPQYYQLQAPSDGESLPDGGREDRPRSDHTEDNDRVHLHGLQILRRHRDRCHSYPNILTVSTEEATGNDGSSHSSILKCLPQSQSIPDENIGYNIHQHPLVTSYSAPGDLHHAEDRSLADDFISGHKLFHFGSVLVSRSSTGRLISKRGRLHRDQTQIPETKFMIEKERICERRHHSLPDLNLSTDFAEEFVSLNSVSGSKSFLLTPFSFRSAAVRRQDHESESIGLTSVQSIENFLSNVRPHNRNNVNQDGNVPLREITYAQLAQPSSLNTADSNYNSSNHSDQSSSHTSLSSSLQLHCPTNDSQDDDDSISFVPVQPSSMKERLKRIRLVSPDHEGESEDFNRDVAGEDNPKDLTKIILGNRYSNSTAFNSVIPPIIVNIVSSKDYPIHIPLDLSTSEGRLASFLNADVPLPATELVRAGFSSSSILNRHRSAVFCFRCHIELDRLNNKLHAMVLHKTFGEDCPFMLEVSVPEMHLVTDTEVHHEIVVNDLVVQTLGSSATPTPSEIYKHYNTLQLSLAKQSDSGGESNEDLVKLAAQITRPLETPKNDFREFGVMSDSPKHPNMALESNRKETMKTYHNTHLVDPKAAVTAGFFWSGQGDQMICFSCGIEHSDWTADTAPLKRHMVLSPKCTFLLSMYNQEYIDQTIANEPAYTPPPRQVKIESVPVRSVKPRNEVPLAANIRKNSSLFFDDDPPTKRLVEKTWEVIEERIKYGEPDYTRECDLVKDLLEKEKALNEITAEPPEDPLRFVNRSSIEESDVN